MDSAHIVAVGTLMNKNAPDRARFSYQLPIMAAPGKECRPACSARWNDHIDEQ
jgi:hypothetical protein